MQSATTVTHLATTRRYLLLSILSGLFWGAIAAAIGHWMFHGRVWAGLVASPVIGLIVGLFARRFIHLPFGGLAILSLVDLHLGAALFALAIGVLDWLLRDPELRRFHVLFDDIPSVLWGLTVSGWVFLLWPLSIANHLWLARGTSRTA